MRYVELQVLESIIGRICPDRRRAIMSLVQAKSIILDSEAISIVRRSESIDVHFTDREKQVAEYLLAGLATKEIAVKMKYASAQCVKNIFVKLHAKCKTRSRIQLAFFIKSYPQLLARPQQEVEAEQIVLEVIQQKDAYGASTS